MNDRPCEVCSLRPARLVVLRRRGEDSYRTYVCQECANQTARSRVGARVDFESVLDRMRESRSEKSTPYSCRLCGTTLADVIVDGRPGCCLCYSRFSEDIGKAIDESQGRSTHVGKSPGRR